MIRRRPSPCLDAQTLAALTHGKIPSDELLHIQQHLPQCSKCIGAIAAGVQRRAAPPAPATSSDSAVLVRVDAAGGRRLLPSLAVALSLLALGSSVTCWYLDPAVAGKSRGFELIKRAMPTAFQPTTE